MKPTEDGEAANGTRKFIVVSFESPSLFMRFAFPGPTHTRLELKWKTRALQTNVNARKPRRRSVRPIVGEKNRKIFHNSRRVFVNVESDADGKVEAVKEDE
jgi:hypothetical protein